MFSSSSDEKEVSVLQLHELPRKDGIVEGAFYAVYSAPLNEEGYGYRFVDGRTAEPVTGRIAVRLGAAYGHELTFVPATIEDAVETYRALMEDHAAPEARLRELGEALDEHFSEALDAERNAAREREFIAEAERVAAADKERAEADAIAQEEAAAKARADAEAKEAADKATADAEEKASAEQTQTALVTPAPGQMTLDAGPSDTAAEPGDIADPAAYAAALASGSLTETADSKKGKKGKSQS